MKKALLILAVVIVLGLVGCKNDNLYVYKGENEDWKAELRLSQLDGKIKKEFILAYKGQADELENIQEISHRYETPTFNSQQRTHQYLTERTRDRVYRVVSEEDGKLFAEESDVIKVVVELDGESEVFELTGS